MATQTEDKNLHWITSKNFCNESPFDLSAGWGLRHSDCLPNARVMYDLLSKNYYPLKALLALVTDVFIVPWICGVVAPTFFILSASSVEAISAASGWLSTYYVFHNNGYEINSLCNYYCTEVISSLLYGYELQIGSAIDEMKEL